jgi:hypothetical protein
LIAIVEAPQDLSRESSYISLSEHWWQRESELAELLLKRMKDPIGFCMYPFLFVPKGSSQTRIPSKEGDVYSSVGDSPEICFQAGID